MAEWFKRGTVNTFYRGSNPLKALKIFNFILGLLHASLYKIKVKK